jgi:hypothetical protein
MESSERLPPSSTVRCRRDRTIEINPNRLMHYIELGLTYAQMGKGSDARDQIAKGLAMPNVDNDDPEIKRRGRDALAHLQ